MNTLDPIDALVRVAKAGPGMERAGHKYKRRVPDGKGGWEYIYDEPKGRRAARVEPAKAELAPSRPTMNPPARTTDIFVLATLKGVRQYSAEERASVAAGGSEKRVWVPSVAMLGLPLDTQAAHSANGTYTEERKKLHATIIDSFTSHVKSVPKGQQPVAIVTMGGSGAGKGSILKAIVGDHNDFVVSDPDAVKEALPEYQAAVAYGEREGAAVSALDAAAMAHEESSTVAAQVQERAVAERKNLILDGTGRNAEKYAAKIEALKKAGYHVRVVMPHVPMREAVGRARNRANRSGRYVPDHFVSESHHVIPGNFEKIARAAHEFALFDNTKGPRLVWSGGEGQEDTVHDSQYVAQFKLAGDRRHARARKLGWLKSLRGTNRRGMHMATDAIDALALVKAFPPGLQKKKKPAPETDYLDGGGGAHPDDDTQPPKQKPNPFGAPDDDNEGDDDNADQEADDGADTDEGGQEDDDADGGDSDGDRGDGDGAADELDQEAQQASGDSQALIQQIADLERDYYAAKGMHGGGHHKTEAMLDQLMRAVRKLVRALVGSNGVPANGPGDESQEDADQDGSTDDADGDGTPNYVDSDDAGSSDVGTEAADPDGDGDVTNDDEGDADESYDGEDQQEPRDESADQASAAGNVPKKKKPFGKSLDALDALGTFAKAGKRVTLRKSLEAFDSPNANVPGQHLYEYLVSFMQAAHATCSLDQPHAADNLAVMVPAVMSQLVRYVPKNPAIKAAVTQYSVNAEGIAKILKERGMVDALKAAAEQSSDDGDDGDGAEAMGAKNIAGEVHIKSAAPEWYQVDGRAKELAGAPGVPLRPPQASAASRLTDDTLDPFIALRKAQQARQRQAFQVPEAPAYPTVSNACMIHGPSDLLKSHNVRNEFARCSCPKG